MTGTSKRLHLGCGRNAPPGWVNVDGSWSARLAGWPRLSRLVRKLLGRSESGDDARWPDSILVHDVRRPLPFADGSFDAVYASHLLEHLFLDDARALLRECFRVLRPGGAARFVVPDLRAMVQKYLKPAGVEDECAADVLVGRMGFRDSHRPSGRALYRFFAAHTDFHTHKWMYDAKSLVRHMQKAGFVEVAEAPFRSSRISGIDEVEEGGRVLNGEGICVEGVRS